VIELERRINAPAATVFAYFTDADRYTAWMGTEAELDARPGGIYRVRVPQGQVALGRFVEVDPPTRIVFTWGWEGDPDVPPGSSRVEVTLEADGDATLVRLVHTGLPDASSMTLHERGWARYLDRLTVSASGGDPGADLP
jgi:uncharacterized protein YndB with AHSA1/START domain